MHLVSHSGLESDRGVFLGDGQLQEGTADRHSW